MLKQILTCCEDKVTHSNSENVQPNSDAKHMHTNALKPVNYIRNFQYKSYLTTWKKMCM